MLKDVLDQLESLTIEEKRAVEEAARAAVARELGAAGPAAPDACPRRGCPRFVRKGRNRDGSQRWLCRGCGQTFSAKTMSLLGHSRLKPEVWLDYVSDMLSGASLRGRAELCGVPIKTSWFMRMRLCEVMARAAQPFRTGEGVSWQVDGTYLDESLTGNRSRSVKEMIDAEDAARQERKVAKLVREARFKEPAACVEDVIYMPERKLSKDRLARLAECGWVEGDEVLVAISKTGCGKSFVAQALGNAACRRLHPTRYVRLADLCGELNRARMAADVSHCRAMDRLRSVKLLIIDDFLATPVETVNSVDLFEILEAREGRRATLIASQPEPDEWYRRIESELIADSILGRVASACRYLDIDGPNMRKWLAENRPRGE